MFNFGFGQKALNDKFKKIIIDTEKKHDVKVSEYGIDNKLWTDNTASFKENDTISFYTTSNLPFCKSKLFIFYPKNFLTINYDNWPLFSRVILLFLMFVGGMAGSTAGGIKISRVLMLYKTAKAEIKYAMNPSRIQVIKYNGKELDSKTHRSVLNYFALYFIIFGILLVIVSLETPTFDSSFSSVLATFNNIGPGMADIGPTENFAWFSDHTKIVLTISMYLGRLEILPVLVFLNPKTWKIR